ncbi:50S ribosomal protein L9 [bacterium]|nr:50S ribosomal protein L9 [bacterium]
MEVILTQDITKLGKRGDLVKVKEGYARNFLFPKKLALLANDSNKRHFTEIMKQTRARMEKQKISAEEMRARLDGEHVKLTLAFGETGKAYGSVTAKEISAAFREKGLYFDHHQVMLDHSLREAGAHDVQIRIFADVIATVKVWIVPEGSDSQEQRPVETQEVESADQATAEQEPTGEV